MTEGHETWRDHVDESGRFFTCKGIEGPQPLTTDDEQDDGHEEGTEGGSSSEERTR